MTNIEWTEATFNPIVGCSRISPGCDNCYAVPMSHRLESMAIKKYEGITKKKEGGEDWSGEVRFAGEVLERVLNTRKATIWFPSMADFFHYRVKESWLDQIWVTMSLCPQHTFQILTKRPFNAKLYLERAESRLRLHGLLGDIEWPLKNVWIGTSVESTKYAIERIPYLLQTPAALRFLSCEPLLGDVAPTLIPYLKGIDWVIAGGESGTGARTCYLEWIENIVNACHQYGVSCFVKQMGKHPVYRSEKVLNSTPKGSKMSEWPESIRVREYPKNPQNVTI